MRPRFFGGMLLTEDDLQAAVDYAMAKRRLTNRHVIGAGVVCGLDGDVPSVRHGKVSVSAGYAIECCGNDIVVGCPEEVDILALVRDLRKRRGVDCGEPCEQQPRQDYYLYVRYAETPTAPVAPYATDDCATGDCEFSRVREGYCFELRCDPPPPHATASVLDALDACRPGPEVKEHTETLRDVVTLVNEHGDSTADETRAATTVEETFVTGAETIRSRVLNNLGGLGQTTCDDYRKVSALRFDALTADSKKDVDTLADAYLRSVAACTCAAFHPPIPDCTDDAVVLAKVRVEDCAVTEVCALERRWAMAPRSLGYWLPAVEMLRVALEELCCGERTSGPDTLTLSLRDAKATAAAAVSTVAATTGAQPEFRELLSALGRPEAAPAPPVASAAEDAAGVAGDDASVRALEVRLEELSARIDTLTAAKEEPR